MCSPVKCSPYAKIDPAGCEKKSWDTWDPCGFWKFLLWNRAGYKIYQIHRIRRNTGMYLDPVNSTKSGRVRENTAYRQWWAYSIISFLKRWFARKKWRSHWYLFETSDLLHWNKMYKKWNEALVKLIAGIRPLRVPWLKHNPWLYQAYPSFSAKKFLAWQLAHISSGWAL